MQVTNESIARQIRQRRDVIRDRDSLGSDRVCAINLEPYVFGACSGAIRSRKAADLAVLVAILIDLTAN